MKIIIQYNEMVHLKFEGRVNMSQEVTISKNDAKKLGQILIDEASSSFETRM